MSSDSQDQRKKKAVADITGYVRANRIEVTKHARERMEERNVRRQDIIHALLNATSWVYQPSNDTWKVTGPDLSELSLAVVVAIDDGVIVVTIF